MSTVFATNESQRWVTPVRIVLFLIAAGALVLIGRMTAPTDRDARFAAGVRVGFDRSADGARAAAMTYGAARGRAKLLAPERRREVLAAIGTSDFAFRADREDEQQDLAPLAGQDEGRYLVTALGSHAGEYSDDRARVTVWLIQVWAADTAVASFSTQEVTLVWRDDDWRLNGQEDSRTQAVPQVTQRPRFDDTRELVARGLS